MHIPSPVTDNCSSWISGRGRMAVEIFSWPSLHERMWVSNSGPLACQANSLPIELPRPMRKGGKTIDLYCYIKVLKAKPVYQQMTLSPKLGVLEISTLWHFRLPLLIQMFIKVASSPRLSGIGMTSPILWSHLLIMQRIVLLSSLLWWELGNNSVLLSDCCFGVSLVYYPDTGTILFQ